MEITKQIKDIIKAFVLVTIAFLFYYFLVLPSWQKSLEEMNDEKHINRY
jgi:hypothetical protein